MTSLAIVVGKNPNFVTIWFLSRIDNNIYQGKISFGMTKYTIGPISCPDHGRGLYRSPKSSEVGKIYILWRFLPQRNDNVCR